MAIGVAPLEPEGEGEARHLSRLQGVDLVFVVRAVTLGENAFSPEVTGEAIRFLPAPGIGGNCLIQTSIGDVFSQMGSPHQMGFSHVFAGIVFDTDAISRIPGGRIIRGKAFE